MTNRYISAIKRKTPLEAGSNEYPFFLPVFRNFEALRFNRNVSFFVGENGTGKSTLLEAIAVGFGLNPEGGSKNFHFSTAETHSPLYRHITLVKGVTRPKDGYFLRAESFYNVVTEIDRLDAADAYGGKSLHAQSHGESFISLIYERFFGNGLYILDEPEAALSPSMQLSLLKRIYDMSKENSQFIIATHSPILMACPDAEIFQFSGESISIVSYKETEHYRLMKYFLNNPEGVLKQLLDQ